MSRSGSLIMFIFYVQIKTILQNTGVDMPVEAFENIWKIAEGRDPQGKNEVYIPFLYLP